MTDPIDALSEEEAKKRLKDMSGKAWELYNAFKEHRNDVHIMLADPESWCEKCKALHSFDGGTLSEWNDRERNHNAGYGVND